MGIHPFTIILFLVLVAGSAVAFLFTGDPLVSAAPAVLAVLFILSARVAKQWEKAVVLRIGSFRGLKGPGLFFLFPFVDTVTMWIDTRTIATTFNAEQTLTKDTVPVDVDAVLFWRVVDAERAALQVEEYREAVFWAAQTALRDVIGKTSLDTMLGGREETDELLRETIDRRTEAWGIEVAAVEIRDVNIPDGLQDAMSMQAQADKEREARVILADSERRIAETFRQSAESYANNPVALHLRAMNILLEGMRENSTVVVVPSSALQSMGLGQVAGLSALGEDDVPPRPPTPAGGAGGRNPKPT